MKHSDDQTVLFLVQVSWALGDATEVCFVFDTELMLFIPVSFNETFV